MFKTYGEISRFSDGLALNITPDFICLTDISDTERIGKPYFGHNIDKPMVVIDDITSKKRLEFEGDYLRIGWCPHIFSWFPQIKEIGVLYDGFDNDVQRKGIMQHNLKDFLLNEIFFETAQSKGMPVGEEARGRMASNLDTPAFLYTYSVELLYAGLSENRDVLIASYIKSEPSSRARESIIHNPVRGMKFNLNIRFNDFLESNPELRKHLTDGGVVADKAYHTSEKIIDKLTSSIPSDVLESMYCQFKSGFIGKKRLEALRAENPREKLEEQLKDVDTMGNYTVGMAYFNQNLELINKS